MINAKDSKNTFYILNKKVYLRFKALAGAGESKQTDEDNIPKAYDIVNGTGYSIDSYRQFLMNPNETEKKAIELSNFLNVPLESLVL